MSRESQRRDLIKSLEYGNVEVKKNGNEYTFSGKTYNHKDILKKMFENYTWNSELKNWTVSDPWNDQGGKQFLNDIEEFVEVA